MGPELYAGGNFIHSGGNTMRFISRWDGANWLPLQDIQGGEGVNGSVSAIVVSGPDIYVGGSFSQAGPVDANNIAKWDGVSWSTLGSGTNSGVHALVTHGTDLYAGGFFDSAGGVSANHVARWDGSSWSPLGTGMGTPGGPDV